MLTWILSQAATINCKLLSRQTGPRKCSYVKAPIGTAASEVQTKLSDRDTRYGLFTPSTRQSTQFWWVLSRLEPVSNLQLIACSHRRRGQDKTVLSRPRRRCEQALTHRHSSATVFKDDDASQWKSLKFALTVPKCLTNDHQKQYGWLCRAYLHMWKISLRFDFGIPPPHIRSYLPDVYSVTLLLLSFSNSLQPKPLRRFWLK